MNALPASTPASCLRPVPTGFGWRLRHARTAVLLVFAGHQAATAAQTTPEWFAHTRENAWLNAYDPTLIGRRLLSEFSYENDAGDAEFWKLETSLRWAIPIHKDLAFGMQALIPVKWNDTATASESGIGDLELRTGLVGRISPTLRYGIGLNAEFDTAADSSLGDNALALRPITAIRWDVARHVNIGLNLEYTFTPRDEGADDISEFELKFPLVVKLNDDWSAAATYKPKWNLLTESDRHRFELGATRVWGADHEYALSFGTEVPLSSDTMDFKLISGFTWYF